MAQNPVTTATLDSVVGQLRLIDSGERNLGMATGKHLVAIEDKLSSIEKLLRALLDDRGKARRT